MLNACLLCAALHAAQPAKLQPVQDQLPSVITPTTPNAAQPGLTQPGVMPPGSFQPGASAPGGLPQTPHAEMTPNQSAAMQLYSKVARDAADTALQSFQAAIQAGSKGAGGLARNEMRLGLHGAANASIAEAETIAGHAKLNHPGDDTAAQAEFQEKIAQRQTEIRGQIAGAPDAAHRQLYTSMASDMASIQKSPGVFAAPNAADQLWRSDPQQVGLLR